MTTQTTTTEIYFDRQDPDAAGWAYRTREQRGPDALPHEESGPIDDARIARALDAIYAGHAPSADDLDALRDAYPAAVLYSEGGAYIGPIFPESADAE